MSDPASSSDAPRLFPHTHWSVVLAATRTPSPESAAALEAICCAYWQPLYAYVRRTGQSPHDAQDLTQEFFRLLLEKRWLHDVNREKGRLRTFLITALKGFMSKEWRRASAQKRGGGQALVELDTRIAESHYAAVAAQLGVNSGTARVAVHRLRKRFREIYREEISQTLAADADLNAELRHLAAALACEDFEAAV